MQADFLDRQFAAQTTHYARNRAEADRWIITRQAMPVGRLMIDRTVQPWRLLELSLLPRVRGGGIGGALVRWLQHAAAAADAALDLHVALGNSRAAALYHRLGFIDADSLAPSHTRLMWRAPD